MIVEGIYLSGRAGHGVATRTRRCKVSAPIKTPQLGDYLGTYFIEWQVSPQHEYNFSLADVSLLGLRLLLAAPAGIHWQKHVIQAGKEHHIREI